MPEIELSYISGLLNSVEIEDLKAWLRDKCVELFSVEEHPLRPGSFWVRVIEVVPPSELRSDVHVRIMMHSFPTRIKDNRPDDAAAELAYQLDKKLRLRRDSDGVAEFYARAVDVTLIYAIIGFASR